MEAKFKEFLFEKCILVHEKGRPLDKTNDVLLSLMTLFAIRVKEGFTLADKQLIEEVSEYLGVRVPLPFYRGFPQSVRALSPDERLFDQLWHYAMTYGFGNFDEAGHSVMEEYLERVAFKEEVEVRDFVIVEEEEAYARLSAYVTALLASSRPLNERDFALVKAYLTKFPMPDTIASKNTAIRLLVELRDPAYAVFLTLSDVVKVVDYINYSVYENRDLKLLNFKNRDRVFIARILDAILDDGIVNFRECFEKKAIWRGLLHHIHYQPKCARGIDFVSMIRGKGNISVYSAFEARMSEGDTLGAAELLSEKKGSGALLRSLHYLLSRAQSEEEVRSILSLVDTKNVMILLQLYIRYRNYAEEEYRLFRFTRYNRLVVHKESHKEACRRKTVLPDGVLALLSDFIGEKLKGALSGRLGKVYIEQAMKQVALPMQENTSMGGFGVLPRGSRLSIGEGKKLRAFIYWEKVNDIDLAAIGFDAEGKKYEFSWRTMAGEVQGPIVFSGDETSGYTGGSEYYDIDLEAFAKKRSDIVKLVFTANVYSGSPFSQCVARAGYMMRDEEDSGEIYEPKTVKSSFAINCDSTMAYLFGVDLVAREFIWLNLAKHTNAIVAATESTEYLLPYFTLADAMNYYDFFAMMAKELVTSPEEADLVIGDGEYQLKEGAEQIASYEYEKLFGLMN